MKAFEYFACFFSSFCNCLDSKSYFQSALMAFEYSLKVIISSLSVSILILLIV